MEIDWGFVAKLTSTTAVGYLISWLYFAVVFYLLKGSLGKVKAATVAYATSWLVWIGSTAALQKMVSSPQTESSN